MHQFASVSLEANISVGPFMQSLKHFSLGRDTTVKCISLIRVLSRNLLVYLLIVFRYY